MQIHRLYDILFVGLIRMGFMFKNLQETIKALNADAKNVTNCEKAKKLRKKLLTVGLLMAIGGFLGVAVCFGFMFAGFQLFEEMRLGLCLGICFPLCVICLLVATIGLYLANLGFEIGITGYTTNLIDETVGINCPNCGKTIDSEMFFCPKCGARIRKECPNCKHSNSHKSDYCEKCGTKLD